MGSSVMSGLAVVSLVRRGQTTMDCLQMLGRTYFQGDSTGDPILGVAEKQVEDPAVDCAGDATGA